MLIKHHHILTYYTSHALRTAHNLLTSPMPRTRKKKIPITNTDKASSSSTPTSSRTVIRRFHVLLKKQRQLKNASSANAEVLGEIEHEIDELGGLAAYQRMSSIGQGNDRGGGSEKVLIQWLIHMELRKREAKGKLRYLRITYSIKAIKLALTYLRQTGFWKLVP